MIRLLLFSAIIVLFSCANKISSVHSGECEWNKSKTVVLCIESLVNEKSKIKTIRYHVYNKANEILKEGTLNGGYVRWLDENAIEIYQPPGMIREGTSQDDLVKVFLINSLQVVNKTFYLSADQK